jgi:hypothetical protein
MQMVIPLKLRLNATYNRVCVGKLLSHMFAIKKGLEQGHVLSPLLFKFSLEYDLIRV